MMELELSSAGCLMFHHFHGGQHNRSQGSISGDEFERILDLGGDRLISSDEWIRRLQSGQLTNELCISMDDNLLCQFDIGLPIIEGRGLKAIWFINSGTLDENTPDRLELYRAFRSECFPDVNQFYDAFDSILRRQTFGSEAWKRAQSVEAENYLSEFTFYSVADKRFRFIRDVVLGEKLYNQVMDALIESSNVSRKEIARNLWMNSQCLTQLSNLGHEIGLHSHSHPVRIDLYSREQQSCEYGKNAEILENITGLKPRVCAYPCGLFNKDTIEVMQELEVVAGFKGTHDRPLALPMDIPRLDHGLILKGFAGT